MITATSLITASLLFVVLASLGWSWARRVEIQRWEQRSNARVLREYKRMSIHEPEKIITLTYRPTRKAEHSDN